MYVVSEEEFGTFVTPTADTEGFPIFIEVDQVGEWEVKDEG